MKIMTSLAAVLFFAGWAAVSPVAAQAVPAESTAEEYFPPEESPEDVQLAPLAEAATETEPEVLDPGAWDLSPGTEILVPDKGDGYWYPASIVDGSAGMFSVRYFDPGKPDEFLAREDFRVQALTEGVKVKIRAEGDELIEGVIVSRQGRDCSVALKADGSVRDVACGEIVIGSP